MVVDNGDGGNIVRDGGILENGEVIGIHDDKQSVGANEIHACCRVYEDVTVFGHFKKAFGTVAEVFVVAVDNDLGRHAAVHTKPRDTHAGTDGIEIGVAVSHDDDIAGSGDESCQLSCDDTRHDLGSLLNIFGTAAEELKTVLAAQRYLVTAALKRHVKRGTGACLTLGHIASDV